MVPKSMEHRLLDAPKVNIKVLGPDLGSAAHQTLMPHGLGFPVKKKGIIAENTRERERERERERKRERGRLSDMFICRLSDMFIINIKLVYDHIVHI